MKRKVIALFLTVLLTISMITGCAKKEESVVTTEKTETTRDEKTEAGDGARETATAKDGTVFYKTGLPIVDKPVSFTIWASTTASDPSTFPMCKIYEEDTGVSPEWIPVSPEGLTERRNLMWASGDYPDVLGPSIPTATDIDTYGPMGIIAPLNDYIDEYLVNLRSQTTED